MKIFEDQSPTKYDVCNTVEITASSGIITSPGYPSYKQTLDTCVTRISVPFGKTINIYTYDINTKSRNSLEEYALI